LSSLSSTTAARTSNDVEETKTLRSVRVPEGRSTTAASSLLNRPVVNLRCRVAAASPLGAVATAGVCAKTPIVETAIIAFATRNRRTEILKAGLSWVSLQDPQLPGDVFIETSRIRNYNLIKR
jgi:hypothetical protein